MPDGSKKRYNITAFAYDKNGKLLSVGKNSYTKTHPLQAKYAMKVDRPLAIYLHAEMDAMIKARGKIHRIVVTRFDSNGKPKLARPCPVCQLALSDYGVRHVEHT